MFGQLKSVNWISKTLLSKSSKEQIKKRFQETPIEFHYPKDLSDFKLLIETFQKKNTGDNDNDDSNEDDNFFL